MTRRAVTVALLALVVLGIILSSCTITARRYLPATPAATVTTTAPPAVVVSDAGPSAEVTVWCGPDPRNPAWHEQMAALAEIGATAVHGPCRTPPAEYTMLEPGARYASPPEQLALAAEASRHGLGFIPYDPRLWSADNSSRAVAVAEWWSLVNAGTVVAIDLGDEPVTTELAALAARSRVVRAELVNVPTFVTFLADGVFGQSLTDSWRALPVDCPATDRYGDAAGALADALALQALAGCGHIAVDTTGRDLDGDGDGLSLELIRQARAHGLRVLLFTGITPENYPTWTALVTTDGTITAAGRAVQNVLEARP